MNDLFEAICEMIVAQTTEQRSERAKELRSAFDFVKTKMESLEKDASRYRWLRKKEKLQQETYMYCCDDELDSEIDSEITLQQESTR